MTSFSFLNIFFESSAGTNLSFMVDYNSIAVATFEGVMIVGFFLVYLFISVCFSSFLCTSFHFVYFFPNCSFQCTETKTNKVITTDGKDTGELCLAMIFRHVSCFSFLLSLIITSLHLIFKLGINDTKGTS